MSVRSPHESYFKKRKTWGTVNEVVFYILISLSFVLTFLQTKNNGVVDINMCNNIVTIITILVQPSLEVIEHRFRTKGNEVLRKDLIDNSFNTKYNHVQSIDYYNNDEIEHGIQKLAINVFESCFWSLKISEDMKDKEFKKMIVISSLIFICSLYGFANNVVAIPILQIFMARVGVISYFKITSFNQKLDIIFDDFKNFFERYNKSKRMNREHNAEMINIVMRYECLIADSRLDLSSELFDKNNPDAVARHRELENEWKQIKNTYNIK